MAPPKPPVWVDANIVINIDKGKMPHAETYIRELQKNAHEVLISRAVQRELLHGEGMRPQDTARMQGVITRLQIKVDTMAARVPMKQVWAWQKQALGNLSSPDAIVVSQVRAGAHARGIRNPVLLTVEQKGAIVHMRRNGVLAVDVRNSMPVRTQVQPSTPPPTPPASPGSSGGAVPGRLSAAKDALKTGIKGAFSAPNLASMLPVVVLAIADKFAVRDAIRSIQVKFLKEGFAKGVAAAVMGWTEGEVASILKNRTTPFRVEGMGDAAGHLTISNMIQVAEAYEVYGVAVGYQFAYSQTLAWKTNMRDKGFDLLIKYRWHFPNDPAILFEYEFIDKLAHALHLTTDAIVEPAIRHN